VTDTVSLGITALSPLPAASCVPVQTIFFIEGAGQSHFDIAWGNGFVTNSTIINQLWLSDPNPFFRALLGKAYRRQVGAWLGAAVPSCAASPRCASDQPAVSLMKHASACDMLQSTGWYSCTSSRAGLTHSTAVHQSQQAPSQAAGLPPCRWSSPPTSTALLSPATPTTTQGLPFGSA
jgi:hypothetical protein